MNLIWVIYSSDLNHGLGTFLYPCQSCSGFSCQAEENICSDIFQVLIFALQHLHSQKNAGHQEDTKHQTCEGGRVGQVAATDWTSESEKISSVSPAVRGEAHDVASHAWKSECRLCC